MHDAHTLSVFFSDSSLAEKTSVLLEVCSRNPELLLEILRDMTKPEWERECRALIQYDINGKIVSGKIDAIKLCRKLTGWGLKEAKDAVEALPAPRMGQII